MIIKLKDALKKKNVGKDFVFVERTLKNHFTHRICNVGDGRIGFLSSRNTIIIPSEGQKEGLEVILLERGNYFGETI